MLGSGGTSPFWAGNHAKTQRKILKAKYTTKIKAFELLSEQIKQLIKRLDKRNRPSHSQSILLDLSFLSFDFSDLIPD